MHIFIAPFKNIIANRPKIIIIRCTFGVSSNGRTRDFGSLYHGSNPCAPTKNSTGVFAGLIFGCARIGQSNVVAHDQYENTQLEKSQKSQELDILAILYSNQQ